MRKSIQLKPFPNTLQLELLSQDLPDGALGLTSLEDDGTITVQISLNQTPLEAQATIVHEAVHAVQFLQQHVETTFDQETEAYMTQFIFRWVCQQLPKFKHR